MFWFKKKYIITFFILPTLIFYLVYMIMPIVMSLFFSFTNYSGMGAIEFVGVENYKRLTEDPRFLISLKNTLIILVFALSFLLPGAFLMSVLLNKKMRGVNIAKAFIFSPFVIAPIVIGLIWAFILDPYKGLINMFLERVGLDFLTLQWIGGGTITPYAVGFVYTWQTLGFITVVFLAGLKFISKDIYEAGLIDGATPRQELFYITIPLLKETFIINVILIITGCFKIFELVVQLTGGGPNHLSEVLVTYMYFASFQQSQYGYGMAISVAIFLISVVVFSFYLFVMMRRERQEDKKG